MYWQLFEIFFFTFAPLVPVNPIVTRLDPQKTAWLFECDGFTSCFDIAKTLAVKKMA
jgi:hypothetical protein